LAQPDLLSAMGNSPSVGLGGGSAHSSRDVRIANPEKEVDRPRASRAPTHNEYTELPASQNPHISIRTKILRSHTNVMNIYAKFAVLSRKLEKNEIKRPLLNRKLW